MTVGGPGPITSALKTRRRRRFASAEKAIQLDDLPGRARCLPAVISVRRESAVQPP